MASSASPQHNPQTRQQSVKEWADPKNDSRYVTRHELKSFFTIYDKAAAKVRSQENERLEGTLLMTLDALTKWKALPWWKRLFTVPPTPEVRRPAPVEGIAPDDADEPMPARQSQPSDLEVEIARQKEEHARVKDALDHGAASMAAPIIESLTAQPQEWAVGCRDCHGEWKHLVAGNDLHPLTPTCPNCGSAATEFIPRPQ